VAIDALTGRQKWKMPVSLPQDVSALLWSVLKGKGAMPAWEGSVTPEEVEVLRAYVGVRSGAIIVKKRGIS